MTYAIHGAHSAENNLRKTLLCLPNQHRSIFVFEAQSRAPTLVLFDYVCSVGF
jgi:hypothetical protein